MLDIPNIQDLRRDVSRLSAPIGGGEIGNFGNAYITSIDRGIVTTVDTIRERQTENREGGAVGLFIGAAGLASLLPHLDIALPVNIDKNELTLAFNQSLHSTIVDEVESLSRLPDQRAICLETARLSISRIMEDADYGCAVRNSLQREPDVLTLARRALVAEAGSFCDIHWSNPNTIEAAAAALKEKPPVYVCADLRDSRFNHDFADICNTYGQTIGFANFTNVHEWIGVPASLGALPFSPQAPIMLSSQLDNLFTHVVSGMDEYIDYARKDFNY